MSDPTVAPDAGGRPPWHPAQGFDEDPVGVLERGHRCCGPVFRTAIDGVETVLVGTGAGPRELFAAERGHVEVLNTPLVHDLFGRAVFNLVGDGHAEARRRLRTALAGRALAGYVAGLVDIGARTSRRWAEQGVMDLHTATREVTLAMSTRVLLGLEAGEADADEFAAAFGQFLAATDAPPGSRRFAAARYWAGRRARGRLHVLFARRAALARAEMDDRSALSGLVAAFDNASHDVGWLGDHLLALLIAARETTASLLTSCLIELADHRAAAELAIPEARAAVTAPGLLVRQDALPVLRAVLTETQRMHSPNVLSVRETTRPTTLGGYLIPAGMRVAYSPSAGHFDPEMFPDPHAFQPGRFLVGGDPVPGRRLWSFGGGAHACLGRALAELMTMTLLVCALAEGVPRLPAGPPRVFRYRPAKAPAVAVPFVLVGQDAVR